MLNPNSDRLDYGQLLTKDSKYTLDFAVGTTYSLDLEALIGVSLALGLSADTDSKIIENPIAVFEALRASEKKIALFCEAGQIHLPNKITSLFMFLEQMVFQVKTPKRKGIAAYPSFHPKFWLIRYIDENNEPLYRVVVLSRNLTLDRSWDVAFCIEGKRSDNITEKNQPINDFVEYLLKYLPTESFSTKRNKIRAMLRELPKIHFETDSKEFPDFDFLPVGVKNEHGIEHGIEDNGFLPLFSDSFHELLIVSPFLSDGVIRDFNERNKNIEHADCVLITGAMSLAKLKPEHCSNFSVYTVKDNIVQGESIVSQESIDIQKQDIHAKLYMVRKYSDTNLYLGSLNASHNAIHGNVEFMIRLKSKNRHLNMSKLLADLFCGDKGGADNPFQSVELSNAKPEERVEVENNLNAIIKEVIRENPRAFISEGENGFNVTVRFDVAGENRNVRISPLFSNKSSYLSAEVVFEGLELLQLSKFYSITAEKDGHTVSRVILIPTTGIPEDRDKAVVSSVVKDKYCFYEYISLLLNENYSVGVAEMLAYKNDGNFVQAHASPVFSGLYEKMLRAAAKKPDKFDEIEFLMKTVSKDGVVPEDFEETYNKFRRAVGLHG